MPKSQSEYAAFLNNQLMHKQYIEMEAANAKRKEREINNLSPIKENPNEWVIGPLVSSRVSHSISLSLSFPLYIYILIWYAHTGGTRSKNARSWEQSSAACK